MARPGGSDARHHYVTEGLRAYVNVSHEITQVEEVVSPPGPEPQKNPTPTTQLTRRPWF